MNYAQIRPYDVTNGPGVRTTLFVSGCTHNCPGCFNKEQQDFNYGKLWTSIDKDNFISKALNENVVGISILGGEPMQHVHDPAFMTLLMSLKKEVNKPVWVWTGYTYEELFKDQFKIMALDYIDVLIDGKFDNNKRDLMLKYRGSSNQRIIDVQKSLELNKVILLDI